VQGERCDVQSQLADAAAAADAALAEVAALKEDNNELRRRCDGLIW
jgi:hypothetical protein